MNLAVQRIRPISKSLIQVHRGHDGTGRKSRDFSAYDSKDKWKEIKKDVFHNLENIKKEKGDVDEFNCKQSRKMKKQLRR